MNYSYLMGINDIEKLKQNNIELFEEYICKTLENGFWNEYLGKDKVFFKFNNGEIKKYILNKNNEKEILNLCCEFADYEFESIEKMLRNNLIAQ